MEETHNPLTSQDGRRELLEYIRLFGEPGAPTPELKQEFSGDTEELMKALKKLEQQGVLVHDSQRGRYKAVRFVR